MYFVASLLFYLINRLMTLSDSVTSVIPVITFPTEIPLLSKKKTSKNNNQCEKLSNEMEDTQ